MTKTTIHYEGNLRTTSRHESGSLLETDAPKDNQGKGERFSPTDLVGLALATCMMTLMGITAQKNNLDLRGMTATVDKEMASSPRRIAKLTVHFHIPLATDLQSKLEQAALSCPVKQSLHPDIKLDIQFKWGK